MISNILQESVAEVLKLVYKHIAPFEGLVCSYSNAIITDTPTSKGLSFVECYVSEGELKFMMINILITHGQQLIQRSNVSTFEIDDFGTNVESIKIIKLELIPYDKSTSQQYLLHIKTQEKDESKASTVCVFTYDLEELIEGKQLTVAPFQIFESKLAMLGWVPKIKDPTTTTKPAHCFVSLSLKQLKYYDCSREQQGGKYYDLTSQVGESIVDCSFLTIGRPFYQNVMVILDKQGHLLFTVLEQQNFIGDPYKFKVFCESYDHYNHQQAGVKILHKESKHIIESRTYIELRIISVEKEMPGVSVLGLLSWTMGKNKEYEYHIEIFFLALTKTNFVLTLIADITHKQPKNSAELLSPQDSGYKIYVRFDRTIWTIDFSGMIELYKSNKTPCKQAVERAIILDQMINFSNQKGVLRFIVWKDGYLFTLRRRLSQIQFICHSIGPLKQKKEGADAYLMMKIRSVLARSEQRQRNIEESQISDSFKALQSISIDDLQRHDKYISNIITKLQSAICVEYTNLEKEKEKTLKLSSDFHQKIMPITKRMIQMKQRINRNFNVMSQILLKEAKEQEKNEADSDEAYQSLLTKIEFIQNYCSTLPLPLSLECQQKVGDMRIRLKDLQQILKKLSYKIDNKLSPTLHQE